MTKASQTRQFIINKTAPVFNTKGYAGTSLTDLTKATGLSKGALYGNFKDKEAIAVAVFYYSMEKVRGAAQEEMAKAVTCKEKLLSFLSFYAKNVFNTPVPGGCPLMNNAVQADDYSLFLKEAVAAEGKRIIHFLAGLFKKGIQRGEFKKGIDPVEMANLFFCSIEGALVISRVSSSSFAMKAVVNHCTYLIKQISK